MKGENAIQELGAFLQFSLNVGAAEVPAIGARGAFSSARQTPQRSKTSFTLFAECMFSQP